MTRRFVIAADRLSAEEQDKLRDFLRDHGGWWHWIENLWLLVTDDADNVSASSIRDHIRGISKKGSQILVFEFSEEIDWATSGKQNDDGRTMADWLKETWSQ